MKKQKSRQGSQRRPKESDDKRSVSTYDGDSRFFSDASGVPIRPPRKKKKSRASGSESSVGGSILQRRRSVRSSVRSNRSIRSNRRGGGGGTRSGPVSYNPSGPPSFVSDHPFRRSGQLRRMDSRGRSDFARRSSRRSSKRQVPGRTPGFMNGNTAQGDVYTRVAIPRSKSFMNVNSQYNLQELFKELKEKEGVESIDDVLKKVISPNGISFNEIKPVYRELLLKLAMTMSQDELFQRSKNIMSLKSQEKKKTKGQQQSKSKKDKTTNSSKNKYPVSASEHSTLSSFLKLTFSSSKQNNNHSDNPKTSSYVDKRNITKTDISGPIPIHPPPSLGKKTPKTTRKATSPLPPTPSPPGSNSSAKHHHPHRNHPPLPPSNPNNNNRTVPHKKPPSPDDFVDDAYQSCSECGYESVCTYDSCSCDNKIPPPKAYQTSSNLKNHQSPSRLKMPTEGRPVNNNRHDNNSSSNTTTDDIESVVTHDCDTDSCISR